MPQLSHPPPHASTIGELKASGWRSRSVKEELRANAIARIRAGDVLFPGILGYGDTVLPQLEHAVLAGHDIIFLGERGQAKTRMIRALTGLLDEWMPIVAGSEINDDPSDPISRYALDLVAEDGDDTAISWIHRDRRFGEKLATPDTSIADLIGEVDPIKVAEGRYLSDELTLHYGLVPRTNRGVFAINELPDLAERIQVGLLNILEERDVQIRGYKVRLPLDVLLVASANPEDYTNRGRMITPLKDRFGAQIRTHYPLDTETEIAIARQEAVLPGVDGGAGHGSGTASDGGIDIAVPAFMENLVATFTQLARQSSHINQRSGVSVRLTVANLETLVAAATRRALRLGEDEAVPRISDLDALISSTAGKIEVEALDEDRDTEVIDHLLRGAVLTVFKSSVDPERIRAIVDEFEGELVANVGDDLPAANYVELVRRSPALAAAVDGLVDDGPGSAGVTASAVELLLEGLHLSKRLNKDTTTGQGGRSSGSATYRGR